MNSATHMNTLPVRADLFGKNTNATVSQTRHDVTDINLPLYIRATTKVDKQKVFCYSPAHADVTTSQLNWLPVQRRVEFKTVHQTLASLALTYLTTDIHLVSALCAHLLIGH